MTGATGKAGRAAVQELREHGYNVVATDAVVGAGEPAHSWRDYVK